MVLLSVYKSLLVFATFMSLQFILYFYKYIKYY